MQDRNLPRALDTDKTANLAVTYVQAAFERQRWLFRRQEGRNDFGIDAEIEIVEKNLVTGRIFKGQIKGQASTEWNNGTTSVPVSVSTYNLWKATPVPVIALLCDVDTKGVYWSLPISQVPRAGAKSISLRFEEQQSLESSFDVLEKLLQSWFTAFSENILREVPHFHRIFLHLREGAGFGDPWSMLPDDVDGECRLFYHHLIELRLRMGLSCAHLPAIDEWYLRSTAIWGDDHALFWGTFDELMSYIEPDYEEALRELRRRTAHVEPRFENQELVAFLTKLSGHDDGRMTVSYAYMDPRMHDPSFARRFDEMLRVRGALKFPQVKK